MRLFQTLCLLLICSKSYCIDADKTQNSSFSTTRYVLFYSGYGNPWYIGKITFDFTSDFAWKCVPNYRASSHWASGEPDSSKFMIIPANPIQFDRVNLDYFRSKGLSLGGASLQIPVMGQSFDQTNSQNCKTITQQGSKGILTFLKSEYSEGFSIAYGKLRGSVYYPDRSAYEQIAFPWVSWDQLKFDENGNPFVFLSSHSRLVYCDDPDPVPNSNGNLNLFCSEFGLAAEILPDKRK